jgi:hypothetical protein
VDVTERDGTLREPQLLRVCADAPVTGTTTAAPRETTPAARERQDVRQSDIEERAPVSL